MNEYITLIAEQMKLPIWFFVSMILFLMIWESVWKLIALWKSARKKHLAWFIILAIFNTAGILPILYIFIFSKMKKKK